MRLEETVVLRQLLQTGPLERLPPVEAGRLKPEPLQAPEPMAGLSYGG